MMIKDTMIVFTSKSIETIFEEGGSGDWRADRRRVLRKKYFIATRNLHSNWTEGNEEHGAAFLIGKISGVKASPTPGRIVVKFSEYALLEEAGVWTGGRNPVAYGVLKKLPIRLDRLEWKQFPKSESGKVKPQEFSKVLQSAKQMVAQALGLRTDSIDIVIRG